MNKFKKIKSAALVFILMFAFTGSVLAADTTGIETRVVPTSLTSSLKNLGLPSGSVYNILLNLTQWLLILLGLLGVIGFVISGILYLTAAGDDKQIGTAKNAMKASIYGVVVGLAGLVAIEAAIAMLSASHSFF